jgi:galactose mutarotase-like enzyme
MMLQLEADGATATLYPERGGLLAALALRAPRGGPARPLLWLPPDFSLGESGWPGGGAPLMFPFAGRVFHNGHPFQYALGGNVLNMPLHGFAYAMPWLASDVRPDSACLSLSAAASSRELFPFDFHIVARYQLAPSQLSVDVTVTHVGPSAQPMPVALGLHPYFTTDGEAATPKLATSAAEEIQVLSSGAAGTASPLLPGRSGPITQAGLSNLILTRHAVPEAQLVFPSRGEALRIGWQPAERCRYVVLWSREPQRFFCVEPWMGLPDAVSNGAGVEWLPAGASLAVRFTVGLEAL